MAGKVNCEHCSNYVYDDDYECYTCTIDLDEDEYARFMQRAYENCPYFQFNDEYKTVRRQI